MHALSEVDANENNPFSPQVHCGIHGNDRCFDCGAEHPQWVSLGFGAFVCLECAGHHRSLGVHITMVRAVKLDVWSKEQLATLDCGGNSRFDDYLSSVSHVPHNRLGAELFEKRKSNFRKYDIPQVLYYSELLRARMDKRTAQPYDEDQWRSLVKAPKTSIKPVPQWAADATQSHCSICQKAFTFINRRHHCRRCGRIVCGDCAPKENTRPIAEWGMKQPVRHCKDCYRSPAVAWTS